MQTESKYPLQLVLRSILVQNSAQLSQTVTSAAQQEALKKQQVQIPLVLETLQDLGRISLK